MICVSYMLLIPYGLVKYRRVKLRRRQEEQTAAAAL
jgi:hypothetical protein